MDNAAFNSIHDVKTEVSSCREESIPHKEGLTLKPRVGLMSGAAIVVGSIIGSGIFISPGIVLERSGSVGLSLVIWAACGLLAVFGSLAYAELGTMIPKSGGEYSYIVDGFSPLHPFWGPLPGFLYSWIAILLLRPASFAVGCLSCASYTLPLILINFDLCLDSDTQEMLQKIVAFLYLGIITGVNYYSVDWTIRIQNIFTTAKLVAIAILVGCGVYQLIQGKTEYLAKGFDGSTTDFGTIATAFYGGLWSYDGWNSLNFVTEEIKNPSVNLPRSLMIGIPLVIVCYLSVNVAYLTVLSPQALANSNAVAVEVGNYLLGPMAICIPIAIAMSIFGLLMTGAFFNGRLCFATAKEGHMIHVLSYLHVESRIPTPALIFVAVITSVLIFLKDIVTMIDFLTFTTWIFYVLTMIVLLILRRRAPNANRPYRVPLIVPILVIIVGTYLVIAPIITNPTIDYLYVLGVLGIGVVFYIPFVYYKFQLRCMESVTRVIQLTLNVGPTLKPLEH